MTYNPQYNNERIIINTNSSSRPYIVPFYNDSNFNTNDPYALCLSGNAFTMKTKGE